MVDRIATKPDFSQGVWAESGTVSSPSSDKIQVGHVVEKPPYQTVNWVENRQDNGILYLMQNGLASWSNSLFYPQYAIITRNGVVYQALQQNTNQDPITKTNYWVKAFYSYTDGSKLADYIQNILDKEGFLDLYVSKANPVMSATCKGVGYSDSNGTDGLFFDDNGAVLKDDGNIVARAKPVEDITESSDKIVTMAVLQQVISNLQPFKVGSIYITTTTNNPHDELGYGEWEAFAEGRCLVGLSSNANDPNWKRTLLSVYGEDEHTLTINEMPEHDHKVSYGTNLTGDGGSAFNYKVSKMSSDFIAPTGGSQAHNNVQPSIVVAFWKRIS